MTTISIGEFIEGRVSELEKRYSDMSYGDTEDLLRSSLQALLAHLEKEIESKRLAEWSTGTENAMPYARSNAEYNQAIDDIKSLLHTPSAKEEECECHCHAM